MPLAGQQPARRVEPDPAGPGQVDLGPGVQVGEVGRRRRSGRRAASRRRRAGSGSPTRTGPPGRGAAAAAPAARPSRGTTRCRRSSVSSGVWMPGSRRITYSTCCWIALVQLDEEVDRRARRRLAGRRRSAPPASARRAASRGTAPARGVSAASYANGNCSAYFSRKKSNGLMTVISATRSTSTANSLRLLREDEPGQVVAVRVLLPVEEVVGRRDLQRVADDRRAAVRGRAEPDDVRRQPDRRGRTGSGSCGSGRREWPW